jgi:3-mercaptopyruvate sulfurtransferase SseA
MRRGYDRVGVIHGGFDAWMRKELPTQPRLEEVRLLAGNVADSPPGMWNPSA